MGILPTFGAGPCPGCRGSPQFHMSPGKLSALVTLWDQSCAGCPTPPFRKSSWEVHCGGLGMASAAIAAALDAAWPDVASSQALSSRVTALLCLRSDQNRRGGASRAGCRERGGGRRGPQRGASRPTRLDAGVGEILPHKTPSLAEVYPRRDRRRSARRYAACYKFNEPALSAIGVALRKTPKLRFSPLAQLQSVAKGERSLS